MLITVAVAREARGAAGASRALSELGDGQRLAVSRGGAR